MLDMLDPIEYWRQIKNILISIANAYKESEKYKHDKSELNYRIRHILHRIKYSDLEIGLTLDYDGLIKPRLFKLWEIFTKEKIHPSRIRICEMCSKIFWAKKLNAKTCGKSCASTLYNHKRLAKNKEERKTKQTAEEQRKIDWEYRKNRDFSKK